MGCQERQLKTDQELKLTACMPLTSTGQPVLSVVFIAWLGRHVSPGVSGDHQATMLGGAGWFRWFLLIICSLGILALSFPLFCIGKETGDGRSAWQKWREESRRERKAHLRDMGVDGCFLRAERAGRTRKC